MPNSTLLAARIRDLLQSRHGIGEKRLFGSTAFLQYGNILVCAWGDRLIARIGVEQASIALQQRSVGPMDITGRPMKGWVIVAPAGIEDECQLKSWIDMSITLVNTLEPRD